MMNIQLFPILVAAIFTVLLVLLGVLIFFYIRSSAGRKNYDEQLQELLEDEHGEKPEPKLTLTQRWNSYWGKLFRGAGLSRYGEENNNAGRDVLIGIATIALIIGLVTQNAIAGIVLAFALTGGIIMLTRGMANRKSNAINYQLPGFISALKANIQASDTYERAMLKIIDNMPSPLYEDLVVVKHKLLASSSFREALEELSRKTASRDLQFLTACLIQATTSGANMESQLVNIQKVLEQRRKVQDEINRAVQSAMPAMIIATIAIPGAFLFSFFFDGAAKDFWFQEPLSWAALAATGLLYAGGLFLVKRQVDSIKNL